MSIAENKAVIQRLFQEVINDGRLEVLEEIFLPGSMIGRSFADSIVLLRTAFPDAQATFDFLVGEEEQVVAVFTVTGTNTGPFMGQPATGLTIAFSGIHYYRLKNGRVVTARYEHDMLGLMEQLGMLPSGSRPDI
jgi:predicted ester cyclase